MLDVLLCLVCLAALCLFFASLRGVNSASAPLLALCAAILWHAAFGMLGLLRLGGWLFYGLSLALGAAAFLRRGRVRLLKRLLSPGLLLFFGAALALGVWFSIRQPLFTGWDEYSFWGIAAKITKTTNGLYPMAETGFFWTMTEYPALVVLSYFAQFFGAFAPWKVYWAYGLLYLACAAAMLAPFGRRHWRIAVPLAVCGLAVPFFFSVSNATVELATTWLSAYADLPGGVLFGGVLCLYFGVRQSKNGALWQVLLPLAVLGIVKENIMPVALVAAGVFSMDVLVFGTRPGGFVAIHHHAAEGAASLSAITHADGSSSHATPDFPDEGLRRVSPAGTSAASQVANNGSTVVRELARKVVPKGDARRSPAPSYPRRILPRLAWCAASFAAVLAPFFIWKQYSLWANALNPNRNGNLTSGVSSGDALSSAISQLLGRAPMDADAQSAARQMLDSFLGRVPVEGGYEYGTLKMTMAGTGLVTLLLILAVFALCVLLARGRRQKGRIALCGGLLLAGYAAFNFMLFVYYGYISHTRGQAIADYGRYTAAYTAGWLLLGLMLLGLCAKWAPRRAGRGVLGRTAVLALACFMLVRTGALLRPGYSMLDMPQNTFDTQRQREAASAQFAAVIDPDARVFFVCQGGGGGEYFEWHYDLYPTVLDYSITGGDTLQPAPPNTDEYDMVHYADLARLTEYLGESGCEYILIDAIDEGFVEHYSSLFADLDPTEAPALYRMNADGLYARVEV